jgi:RHS repeat-associated protein
VFWTANASDARSQITQETLNNGLVTNRSMDAVTGWLKSIQTGLSGGTGVQNLGYTWDLAGNLKTRKDVTQSNLTEEFFYDNLHRLDYSTLNGVTNLDLAYDALGNITNKLDVGTYTYDATKKHQVTSTSNGWSFGYDNNGNMTSGRGATITWTSFNYPASITNGVNTASFSYTPDRQYWQQVSNYASGGTATTVYVGGLFEKVTTSAGTDFRHFIRAGGSTIIVSRQSTGTNSIHYVTSDHLGSSSAVTDASGGILVNSSFDAFGKRRGSNWSGSPSAGDWAAIAGTTRRGYTDHTMIDNLGLIHMNGRVQDPVLGRFASADPNIPGKGTQHFNRYSYVTNNPLSFSDPSGFVPWQNGPAEDSGGASNNSDDGYGAPMGTADNPIVEVAGARARWGAWVDEAASTPGEDRRQRTCENLMGVAFTETGCHAATSQVGLGSAEAGRRAEENRRERPQGEHDYRADNLVCKRSLTEGEVKELIGRFTAPNEYNLLLGRTQGEGTHMVAFYGIPGGWVTTTFSRNGTIGTNTTTPFHVFTGTVDRWIDNTPGGAYMRTHGTGGYGALNPPPSGNMSGYIAGLAPSVPVDWGRTLDNINQAMGPAVFNRVDSYVRDYVKDHFPGCQ